MVDVFKAVPGGIAALSAVRRSAAATIADAGSSDPTVLLQAVGNALGAFAANYLAAYAPAQANVLAATRLEACRHAVDADRFDASGAAVVRADQT